MVVELNQSLAKGMDPVLAEHYLGWLDLAGKAVDETVAALTTPEQIKSIFGPIPRERLEHAWIEPLRAYLTRGGKLLRPYLMCLCLEAYGKDPREWSSLVALVEIIHSASLILDDVADDSPLRRGGPAVPRTHGIRVGTGAASAWVNLACHLVWVERDRLGHRVADRVIERIAFAHTATGIGQTIDVGWAALPKENPPTADGYLQGVVQRNAYTYRLPLEIGAILAGAPEQDVRSLADFGEQLGVAFQIVDDCLNVKPLDARWGKAFAEDVTDGKYTLPMIVALERAAPETRRRLEEILALRTRDREVLGEAVRMMEAAGALDACAGRASAIIADAKHGLRALAAPELFRQRLDAFADFLVQREA